MEEWRAVKGYEGYYEVSNVGRVRSVSGRYKGRILRIQKQRYATVCLSANKIEKTKTIHRLVAEAFIENPQNKPYIDHVDTNTFNNKVSNLRWVTALENQNNPLTRSHISLGKTGKSRPKYTMKEERKRKIALAKSTPVVCYSLDNRILQEFRTIQDAAKFARVSVFAIYHCIDGLSKSSAGYKWKFKNTNNGTK